MCGNHMTSVDIIFIIAPSRIENKFKEREAWANEATVYHNYSSRWLVSNFLQQQFFIRFLFDAKNEFWLPDDQKWAWNCYSSNLCFKNTKLLYSGRYASCTSNEWWEFESQWPSGQKRRLQSQKVAGSQHSSKHGSWGCVVLFVEFHLKEPCI